MKELQEKINYFKEKIQNLDNLQNLPSDVYFLIFFDEIFLFY